MPLSSCLAPDRCHLPPRLEQPLAKYTIYRPHLFSFQVPDTAARQTALAAEVAHLKRQAALLNHPDTFAQSAKADRKAIALERELTQLRDQQV